MSAGLRLSDIVAEFDAVLSRPDPAPALARQAERLRARLTTDVRIALLGLPGSGKSRLAALLGRLAEARPGQKLPRLQRVALIDTPAAPGQQELQAICARAIAEADILIWCTQHFGAVEQAVWRSVPEEKKDHAFLALTKADALYRAGALASRLAALEEVAVEDFLGIYPVATLQAVTALERAPAPDLDAFRASGGRALAEEIARHVAQGRRSDIDNALFFLRKHAVPRTAAAEESAPEIAPAPAPESAHENAHESASGAAPETPLAATSAPALAPALAPPVTTAEAAEDPAWLSRAAETLRGCGRALLDRPEGDGPAPLGRVLDLCAETLDGLSDMVAEQEDLGLPPSPLQEDILEAADMMLLLRLEDGAEAAGEAATLLLQLKREIEVAIAA